MNKDKYTEVFNIINTLGLARNRASEMMGIHFTSFKSKASIKSSRFFNESELNKLINQTKINIKKLDL